ncbi:hypothetical protein DIE07_13355 [Burkholderia sp. Bp9002]|nr:hypothetical protein DIE18_20915 [Burkholderia sp. Bp9125]RQS10388.1 hypothetical protein DIE07_13355 [Burkholderia sp. Bp9002]
MSQKRHAAFRRHPPSFSLHRDTRDPDFMQPDSFLRLTDIATVMNNRQRYRKPFCFDAMSI